MSGGAIESEVLERCRDDFEAPHTIASDIARDLGRPVTESEVRAAFLSLASKGLVQAYTFETLSSRPVPISSADAVHTDAAWFKAKK